MYFQREIIYKRVKAEDFYSFRSLFLDGYDPDFILFDKSKIEEFINESIKNCSINDDDSIFLKAYFVTYTRDENQLAKEAVVNLLKLAILNRHPFAYYLIALFFKEGYILKRNYKMVISFFQNASNFKDCKAGFQLGLLYYYGKYVKQDYDEAKRYFTFALPLKDIETNIYIESCTILSLNSSYAQRIKSFSKLKRIALIYKSPLANYILGNIYLTKAGNYKYTNAIEHLKKAKSLKLIENKKGMPYKVNTYQLNKIECK